MSLYHFTTGSKQIAIETVLLVLYDPYTKHMESVVRSLIMRNMGLSRDLNQDGFWYKQNTYTWNDWTPKYLVSIPLHEQLHAEMEVIFQEQKVITMEKARIHHWLATAMNYCANPVDVKTIIPEFLYDLMPDGVKGEMLVPSQSILNQSYNMRKNQQRADDCVEAAKLRIMMNSLIG